MNNYQGDNIRYLKQNSSYCPEQQANCAEQLLHSERRRGHLVLPLDLGLNNTA